MFFGAITFLVSPIFGQTIWQDGTGDWFTPGNWSAGVPTAGPGDTAIIDNGGTAQVAAAGATANIMELGMTVGTSGTISVTGAGTLNIPNVVDMGFSGNGTINVTSGGKVTARTTRIATDMGSTGLLSVDGAGSSFSAAIDLISVGEGGNGNLSATAGGVVSSFSGVIGDASSAVGIATINGTGSSWTISGQLLVGFEGNGTLNIQNHGAVSDADAYLGGATFLSGNFTPVATVNVDGVGSTWTNSATLTIGVVNRQHRHFQYHNGGTVSNTIGTLDTTRDRTARLLSQAS